MVYDDVGGSFIAVDGVLAGAVLFTDRLRLESPRALRLLRQAGIRRIVMLTGDREEVAQAIGLAAGVDEVRAGLSPADKLAAIEQGHAYGITLMVGDGINDAPALAAADVGIAMGARGATASSEAAGVVLLADRLDRIAEALQIARRARGIAVQGVLAGMGLSLLAMLLAAAGQLPPLAGAIVQEAIDVAVIVSALRALGGGWGSRSRRMLDSGQGERLREEHAGLSHVLEQVHAVAGGYAELAPAAARHELAALVELLDRELVPHEQADEGELYPQLAIHLKGDDPLAAMSHTHREIFRLIRLLARMNDDLSADSPTATPPDEIQRALQRLDTVLSMHFSQEEELYHNLDSR
jgi:soluble P-type ATPase/iron-sulfur cluster repair protein YtfE (RIC family)